MPCFDLVQIGIVAALAVIPIGSAFLELKKDRDAWRERYKRTAWELNELRQEVIK